MTLIWRFWWHLKMANAERKALKLRDKMYSLKNRGELTQDQETELRKNIASAMLAPLDELMETARSRKRKPVEPIPVKISAWNPAERASRNLLFFICKIGIDEPGFIYDLGKIKPGNSWDIRGGFSNNLSDLIEGNEQGLRNIENSFNLRFSSGRQTEITITEFETEKFPERIGSGETAINVVIKLSTFAHKHLYGHLSSILDRSRSVYGDEKALLAIGFNSKPFVFPKRRKIAGSPIPDAFKKHIKANPLYVCILRLASELGKNSMHKERSSVRIYDNNYVIWESFKFEN